MTPVAASINPILSGCSEVTTQVVFPPPLHRRYNPVVKSNKRHGPPPSKGFKIALAVIALLVLAFLLFDHVMRGFD